MWCQLSVPKSRRKESKFEAYTHYYTLRDEITLLTCNSFGFSREKYGKIIERFAGWHKDDPNREAIVEKMKAKCDAFNEWFIREERSAILDMLRNVQAELTLGNSIYPSETIARNMEFLDRRKHMDAAIGWCYVLKQEIMYVIRMLPVDINKYEHLSDEIDTEIKLIKGVRQADNRLMKQKNGPKRDQPK